MSTATRNPASPATVAPSDSSRVFLALGIVGFAALTALGAHIRIPVPGTPVPMTLQLLAVLLAGYFLGPRAAAASMALYVAAGTAGLGVFAPGSAGLWGVTGGYLCGFVLGAAALSVACGQRRSMWRMTLAGTLCIAIVLCCGVWWQASFLGLDAGDALRLGLAPFLPKAMIELGLAVVLVRLISRRGSEDDSSNVLND